MLEDFEKESNFKSSSTQEKYYRFRITGRKFATLENRRCLNIGTQVKSNFRPIRSFKDKRSSSWWTRTKDFLPRESSEERWIHMFHFNRVLKDTAAIENVDSIQFVTPYAQKQYHENKGNGLLGKEWDQRCWADNGDQIVQSVCRFCRR